MKILMKNLAAGPAGVLLPGKTYDLHADQARELVAGNYAEPAEPPAPAPQPAPPAPAILHATAPPPPVQKAVAPIAPPAPAALGRKKRA